MVMAAKGPFYVLLVFLPHRSGISAEETSLRYLAGMPFSEMEATKQDKKNVLSSSLAPFFPLRSAPKDRNGATGRRAGTGATSFYDADRPAMQQPGGTPMKMDEESTPRTTSDIHKAAICVRWLTLVSPSPNMENADQA